jgi:hypothetical protein
MPPDSSAADTALARRPAAADSSVPAPDSTLGGFLHAMSDSTDLYFGASSAPLDTVGLDSALAVHLAFPRLDRARHPLRPEFTPWLGFNRVDGPVYGGRVAVGTRKLGELRGEAGYAVGPNDWLGGGSYDLSWGSRGVDEDEGPQRRGEYLWKLDTWVGRNTGVIDPDPSRAWQRTLRAFVNGSDRFSYLRRDGVDVSLERQAVSWSVAVGYRDQLESARVTTTTWNLFDATPDLVVNRPALEGRVHEARGELSVRIPDTMVRLKVRDRVSSPSLGSDFDYQRWSVITAGDIPFGHVLSLVPQLEYGRLLGDVVPQSAFYLGGPHSLRSLSTNDLSGTGAALGRMDLVFTGDLLAAAHLPHPAFFYIQGGLFVASGATWGPDPYGGPGSAAGAWPQRDAWLSDVGGSVLWRPGLPEPSAFLRFDYAGGIGNNPRHKYAIYYTAPLDLLRPRK